MTDSGSGLDREQRHMQEVRDFLYHLMAFVFINALLIIIDLRGGEGGFLGLDWAYWVVLFWGLGVVAHAIDVFFGDYRAQRIYEEERKRELEHH